MAYISDPELVAMNAVHDAIRDLTPAQRKRVCEWAVNRAAETDAVPDVAREAA